jgi:hypothetical protein
MEWLEEIFNIIVKHRKIINLAVWLGGGLISSILVFFHYKWRLLAVKIIEAIELVDKTVEQRDDNLISDNKLYALILLKKVLTRTMTNEQKKVVKKVKRKLEVSKIKSRSRLEEYKTKRNMDKI